MGGRASASVKAVSANFVDVPSIGGDCDIAVLRYSNNSGNLKASDIPDPALAKCIRDVGARNGTLAQALSAARALGWRITSVTSGDVANFPVEVYVLERSSPVP